MIKTSGTSPRKGKTMIIEKKGKSYEISERSKHWSVVLRSGALSVDFQVSKDICKNEAELKDYIEKEEMF